MSTDGEVCRALCAMTVGGEPSRGIVVKAWGDDLVELISDVGESLEYLTLEPWDEGPMGGLWVWEGTVCWRSKPTWEEPNEGEPYGAGTWRAPTPEELAEVVGWKP